MTINTTVTLPPWLLAMTFTEAFKAYTQGAFSEAHWDAYRAIWRYSAPRLTDIAGFDLKPVRDINAKLDAQEARS
jgi:hypothetical protein